MKKAKVKKSNRCDIYLKVYVSNVPIGLASEEYIEYLKDDVRDNAVTITDHQTAEMWYDEEYEDWEEGKYDNR